MADKNIYLESCAKQVELRKLKEQNVQLSQRYVELRREASKVWDRIDWNADRIMDLESRIGKGRKE